MSTPQKKTVLITGCSTHGLGYALALAFHDAGFRVFATARDETKMQGMIDEARIRTRRKKGRHSRAVDQDEVDESGDVDVDIDINLLKLDVLDESSIASCVATVEQLIDDGARQGRNAQGLSCLINNAGGGYNMPISDMSIAEGKQLFDLNVWSYISMTQAFLPLLMRYSSSPASIRSQSPSIIVNNTSVSSVEPTPHNSAYHASKAAAAMFSMHMRIELEAFDIKVVDLKTGCVHSRFHANHQHGQASLPPSSLYTPVRAQTEAAMRGAFPDREDPDVWAASVVRDITSSWSHPPLEVWRGTGAWRTWFYDRFWPRGWWDRSWRTSVGLDLLKMQRRSGQVG